MVYVVNTNRLFMMAMQFVTRVEETYGHDQGGLGLHTNE
jgi:hypothetical protein